MNEPATPPADEAQIRTEIATLREAPFAVNESEADRTEKLHAAYRQLDRETAPVVTPRTDPATLALPEGLPWDRDAIAGGYDLAREAGMPRDVVTRLVAIADQAAKHDPTPPTPQTLAEPMIKKHRVAGWDGEQGLNVRAGEALSAIGELGPRGRRLQAALKKAVYYPGVAEYLAGPVYDHLFDPATPQGAARLKERYE